MDPLLRSFMIDTLIKGCLKIAVQRENLLVLVDAYS